MLAVGIFVARKSSSLSDFAVSGRNMSLTVCSISIVATWFGSGPMMGSASAAYRGDALEVLRDPFVSGISLLIFGFFFARMYRRSKRFTHIELLERRYGTIASTLSVFINLIASSIWLGAVLFAFGVVFESLTGQPMAYGILGGTAVIVVYTMFGGLKAVAATDVLQMVFIIVGVIALFFVVVGESGGFAAIPQNLPENAFRLMPADDSFSSWFAYLQVCVSSGLVSIGVVSVVQRAMAARNEQVAQNSFYIAGAAYLLFGLLPVTLGYIAATTMPGVEDPRAIIPLLAVEHLHPIVVVVFVGAVISAIMSTSDSILLGCGTIISVNLLPRVKRDPSAGLQLAVARWSVPVIAVISLYTAFNTSTVISAIALAISFGFAAMSAPYLLSLWWVKANQTGGLSGIAVGIVTFLTLRFTTEGLSPSFIAFWASGFVTIVISLATQESDPPRALTDIDGQTMDLTNRFGTLPLFKDADR